MHHWHHSRARSHALAPNTHHDIPMPVIPEVHAPAPSVVLTVTTPTAGDDIFAGTAKIDIFDGGKGNDLIDGAGGNDQLRGGQGNDTVLGGDGNDKLDGGDGNDSLDGGSGNDAISAGGGNDVATGGIGNDAIDGGNGNDSLSGGDGSDILNGGQGEDSLDGGAGNDIINGGAGRDYLAGGDGDDALSGGSGHDVLVAGAGNDIMDGGSGGDVLLGGDGDDRASGGSGNDYVGGGEGNDALTGAAGHDIVDGGNGDDLLDGGAGDDAVGDGYGDDIVNGGSGNDSLGNSWGADIVYGGAGNDAIVSWSDAGEPEIAQGGDKVNADEPLANADDILAGGSGADTFFFHLTIDARAEIIAKYTDQETGRVDWKGVTGENSNAHDHWVEAIGNDTILDFHRRQGDKIVIEGHTVEVASIEQVDANNDGHRDYSLITLISQQGASGAHDEDQLGTIAVYGDAVTADDIFVHSHPTFGADTFEGKVPVYGSLGDDELQDGRGSQAVYGGEGNDTIIAWGDGGEPVPAQDASGKVYGYDPAVGADDVFIGGHGDDTFDFRILINAKQEILDKHRNGDGSIDWQGVTGENGNVHDHWVEGIGNDTIYDFEAGDAGDGDGHDHGGDMIMLEGHTLAYTIDYRDTVSDADTDDTPDYTVITLYSDQGGAGAHDQDPLGTITVYGDLVTEDHIMLHAHAYWGIDSLEGAIA